MRDHALQNLLREVFEELDAALDDADHPLADLAGDFGSVRRICTFDEAQVLTSDPGLVIEFDDGSEFHLTIQHSRVASRGGGDSC